MFNNSNMQNKQINKLEIHYYLIDNSHSINAFVRNKAEKDLLDALRKIGELLNSELEIETEAYQEGGLKEFILIGGLVLGFLSPSINDIIVHYATKDASDEELDKKIKEETLKNLQLNNKQKELELEKLLEEAADVADAYDKAKFYREKVVSKMKELRAFADELEKLVDKKAWPFPTYEDLLFRL